MEIRGNLFGYYKGKLGLNYGRMVHGVNLGAQMPVKRKDMTPTEQQKDQWNRFAEMSYMASAFLSAIRLGLKNAAKNMGPLVSEYDAFFRINNNFYHSEGGIVEVEYGSIVLAKGSLPQVGFSAASFEEPQRVSVTFSPNSDVPGADAADQIYLVIYEPESRRAMLSTPVNRSSAAAEVRLPSNWSGLTVHVYGFAIGAGRSNKGVISDSAYVGAGNVG